MKFARCILSFGVLCVLGEAVNAAEKIETQTVKESAKELNIKGPAEKEQTPTVENADAPTIERIDYVGCRRIDKETVALYLPLRPGDKYDSYVVNESLKALYSTGFYEDVKISMEGNILIVSLKEYPIVNKISFEGNKKISDNDLKNNIKLKSREVLSPAKVREIQQGLLQGYRKIGLYNASVEPKIIKLENNRVNLVFEIKEGVASGIRTIVFVGNNHFPSGELRNVISSKIKRWYRFFVNDDIYDSDRLDEDKALLYRHYREHGFANINILSSVAELSQDKTGFVLKFTVDEGDIYKLGDIKVVSHIDKLKVDNLDKDFECKKGDIYNIALIDHDLGELIRKVNNMGFAAVKVVPEISKDDKTHTVSITYHIAETQKVYVSKIVIRGNSRTRDHIIRREIPLHEGDVLNDTLLEVAENNIRALGFFKRVKIDTVQDPNSPDKCMLQVEVEEQSTGQVMVSASYSTSDGLGLDLSYNESNFYGTGKSLGVSLGSGKTRCGKSYQILPDGTERKVHRKSKFRFLNSVILSAGDPHIFDKDMEGTISLYRYTSTRFDGFSTKQLGTTVGVSYDLTRKIQQGFEYTFDNRKFDDVDSNVTPIIKYQVLKRNADGTLSETRTKKSNLSSLKHNISYTTSFLTGLKGSFRAGVGTTIAGLGGDAKHFKNELYGSYVLTLWKKSTLRFSAAYGVLTKIGRNRPLIQDSFALGLDSFRGFDDCGLGPQAETTRAFVYRHPLTGQLKTGQDMRRDYIGGSKYWKGTVEYKFPLGFPEELQFRGFVFSDFGTVWGAPEKGKKFLEPSKDGKSVKCTFDNPKTATAVGVVTNHKILDRKKIRMSIGFGVSFITPFGPMTFSYAIPVRKEKYDEQQRFLVGFSTTF